MAQHDTSNPVPRGKLVRLGKDGPIGVTTMTTNLAVGTAVLTDDGLVLITPEHAPMIVGAYAPPVGERCKFCCFLGRTEGQQCVRFLSYEPDVVAQNQADGLDGVPSRICR
jgi:hypothetical protein